MANQDVMRAALRMGDRGSFRQSAGGFRPTEAMVQVKDEFGDERNLGGCRRAMFYRFSGVPKTNVPDDNSQLTFAVGHAVEARFHDLWDKAGVLIDSNVRLRWPTEAPDGTEITISGELDGLLREFDQNDAFENGGGDVTKISQDRGLIMEFKTARGLSIEIPFGKGLSRYPIWEQMLYPNGVPNLKYVLQVAVYLHLRKPLEEHYGIKIDKAVLCYAGLMPQVFTSFYIRLEDGYSGRIIMEDLRGNEVTPSQAYLLRDGIEPNLTVDPMEDFTIENLLTHYSEVQAALDADQLPDRDYDLRFTEEQMERMLETGKMLTGTGRKSARYTAWKKDSPSNPIGDFACNYCNWKEHCYPLGTLTTRVEAGEMTEAEAMTELGLGHGLP